MRGSMKFHLLALFALFSLVGCESNPYPTDGVLSKNPASTRFNVRPNIIIADPGTLLFEEGVSSEYKIDFQVPSGRAILSWQGLPEGAVFDETKQSLVWTPGFEAGNDSADPTIKTRFYKVIVTLYSSDNLNEGTDRILTLQVNNTPREITAIGLKTDYAMKEGTSASLETFEINSADFPFKDLRVELKDNKAGSRLVRNDATGDIELRAEFDVDFLKVGAKECQSWSSSCTFKVQNAVLVTAPDGRNQEIPFTIAVTDVRKEAEVSLAQDINVTGDTSISFTAVDGNKEIAPEVKLISGPSLGMFELKKISSANYQSQHSISWSQIPIEAVGQSFQVVLEVCTAAYRYSVNTLLCRNITANLNVQAREIAAPTINRGTWGQGVQQYLRFGKQFSTRLQASAGNTNLRILSISAASSDTDDIVNYSNPYLEITSSKPGIKALTINVVNSVGGVANSVFLYEVLPESWSENLILAASSSAPELTMIESLWGNASRIYNAGHNLNERALAFRKTLTVGTHSLLLPDIQKDIEFYSANLKNVLITSPLLENLPEVITAELKSLGVRLNGRAASNPTFDINNFEILANLNAEDPSSIVKLTGKLTAESFSPGIISKTIQSRCTNIFSLYKDAVPAEEYVIGLICNRRNGGKLVVLGFEWADLKFVEADAGMSQKWFKKLWE